MPKSHVSRFKSAEFQANVLKWYSKNQRVLPWRVRGGGKTDPYKVWLSEIMLQQTTVATVIPYFSKFLDKWPDIHSLANAEDAEVMAAWAGLGYYARARNLLKCARVISQDYDGKFPSDIESLLLLPGIGPYTAAAISTIAFGSAATVMDGNIERIVSRIFSIHDAMPEGKKRYYEHAELIFKNLELLEKKKIRSFPQALMDIGADICTPKAPQCYDCPVNGFCGAHKNSEEEKYPIKLPKKIIPLRKGVVFWIQDENGGVIVEKRSDKRMLGRMIGLPTTDWDIKNEDISKTKHVLNQKIKNFKKIGVIYHVFTHFRLELVVYEVTMPKIKNVLNYSENYFITKAPNKDYSELGFPTVFLKVARLIQKNKG